MQSNKYSGELVPTPLELIKRIAQLVPPPRTHRHRYYGVLAPNSPLRGAVAALAQARQVVTTPAGGQMRIIAFITFRADIHKIPDHIGVEPEAPRIAPARGPPLWDECCAQEAGESVEAEPDRELAKLIIARLPRRSAHYLVSPTAVAAPPPGRGCPCWAPLRLNSMTALKTPGKSGWRPWIRGSFEALLGCGTGTHAVGIFILSSNIKEKP